MVKNNFEKERNKVLGRGHHSGRDCRKSRDNGTICQPSDWEEGRYYK